MRKTVRGIAKSVAKVGIQNMIRTNKQNQRNKAAIATIAGTCIANLAKSITPGHSKKLKAQREEILRKERKKRTAYTIVAGVTGVAVGCAAGYAISKTVPNSYGDYIFSDDGDTRNKLTSVLPGNVVKKDYIAGQNGIKISVDGSVIIQDNLDLNGIEAA